MTDKEIADKIRDAMNALVLSCIEAKQQNIEINIDGYEVDIQDDAKRLVLFLPDPDDLVLSRLDIIKKEKL